MSRRYFFQILMMAFATRVLFCSSPAHADTVRWDGGGSDAKWSTAANWDTDTVPGPSDDVVVDGGGWTVTADVNISINSLTLGGGSVTQILSATGKTITVAASSIISPQGVLILTAGSTINGTGSLSNSGTILSEIQNNALSNMINVSFNNAATGTLNIHWATTNTGTSRLTLANGFDNEGTIELTTDYEGSSAQLTVSNGTLVNHGLIRAVVSPRGFGSGLRTIVGQLTNAGTLQAENDLVVSNPGGTFDTSAGTLYVAAGQKITTSVQETKMGSGTVLSGTGAINFGGTQTLTLLGDVTHQAGGTGPQFVFTGTTTVGGPGTLINEGTLLLSNDVINAPCTNQGLLRVEASTPSPALSTINGSFSNTASGTLDVHWATTNTGTSRLTIANGFDNYGTINLTSDYEGSSAQLTVTNSTLVNHNLIRAALSARGLGSGLRTLSGLVQNYGIIELDDTLTVTSNGSSGGLYFGVGGTFSGTRGLTLQGVPLEATGNIPGDLIATSSAAISIGTIESSSTAGVLSVGGNLVLQGPVALNMDIGGTTPGTQRDQLNIAGTATFAGQLNISLVNRFVPTPGSFHSLIYYASRFGAFSSIGGQHPCPELSLDPFYGTTILDLLISGSLTHDCTCTLGGLQITNTTLPLAILGTPLSVQLQADCGTPPYIFELPGDNQPSFFTISPEGLLSATPDQAGTFTIRVRVTDAEARSSEREWPLTIAASLPPPELTIKKWGPRPVPGRTLQYHVLMRNTGTVAVTNWHVYEYLESWFTFVSATPTPTEVTPDGLIWWDIDYLGPGEYALFEYSAKLDPTMPTGVPVHGTVCNSGRQSSYIKQCFDDSLKCESAVYQKCCGAPTLTPECYGTAGDCVVNGAQLCQTYLESCNEAAQKCDSYTWPSTAPHDPNEKGVLQKAFIKPDDTLIYPIYFENVGDIEALDIFVTDVLDPSLDDTTIECLTPGCSYDQNTRTLRWDLLGINLAAGASDSVLLSVKPLPGLVAGTQIHNTATIQFEVFEPLVTNEVINAIDDVVPECVIDALPATSPPWFHVTWSGSDSVGLIESYSALVSIDGGPFAIFATTNEPGCVFAGEPGHTYSFLCIARDIAGNTEVQAPVAEAYTSTMNVEDNTPPELSVDPPDTTTCVPAIILSGMATDPLTNGVASELESVRVNGVAAVLDGDYFTGVATLSPGLNAIEVIARDYAGNETSQTVEVVLDDEPPSITCPSDIYIFPTDNNGSPAPDVRPLVSTTDNCNLAPGLTQDPLVGEALDLGSHTLTITATDLAGNSAQCTTSVIVAALPVAPDATGIDKTRFISLVPPGELAGQETALRVTLSSLHHVNPPYTGGPSIPFTNFEGQVRWVGPPTQYIESTANGTPFFAAPLQCDPYYQDWSTVGLLHITGSAVVPSSAYEVENVSGSCVGNEADCTAVSPPLMISTTRWGDVETPYTPPSPGQPDFADISALVNKFKSSPGAAIKARALLAGDDAFGNLSTSTLNLDFSFSHIAACVDAFKGKPYPHTIQACP